MAKAAVKSKKKVVVKRCRTKTKNIKYDRYRNGQYQYGEYLEINSREVENNLRKSDPKKVAKKTAYREAKKAARR